MRKYGYCLRDIYDRVNLYLFALAVVVPDFFCFFFHFGLGLCVFILQILCGRIAFKSMFSIGTENVLIILCLFVGMRISYAYCFRWLIWLVLFSLGFAKNMSSIVTS